MEPSAAASAAPVFVTTQPIFDRLANVYGYEMDFRSGFEAEFTAAVARGQATIDFSQAMGFDEIVGLSRGHVTFPRELLIQNVPILCPSDAMVVGVPGDLRGDGELIGACRQLKELGYELELTDFSPEQMDSPFLDFGDIVRLRPASLPAERRRVVCEELMARGVRPLATHVDAQEQYESAHEAGFWYFEGEFFRRPALTFSEELPSQKAQYLALLREVNKPELEYDDLEDLVKLDVAMTYRLLRFVNSVWFGLKQTVTSIRHALVLLGPQEVKLWASMLVLQELGAEKPKELFRRCLLRAKMAEGLAPLIGMESQAPELFLMGMFSLMEALTDVPLARVLEGLPLSEEVKSAVLSQSGPFGQAYAAVEQYEWGQWERLSQTAAAMQIDENALPAVFGAAAKWADNAMSNM